MGFHEFRGVGERDEKGHGREFVGALDSVRYSCDIFREREVDDRGCGVGEGIGDEGTVCLGGEDGEGGATAEEEV